MKRRRPRHKPKETVNTTSPPPRGFGSLLAVGVVAALLIVAVWAYFHPPDDPLSAIPIPMPTRQTRIEPTITLPNVAVEVGTEELRGELLAVAEDLLSRFPQDPRALHVVALLYADLRKTTEAEQLWRQCLALSSKEAGPYVGLAAAAMELGKDEEAVETLQRARQAGCSNEDVYLKLAAALTKLGRLEEAEQVLQAGLVEFPNVAEGWMDLGRVQLQLGQFAEAEVSFKKAIACGSRDPSIYLSLATASARQGQQEAAAQYRREFAARKSESTAAPSEAFQDRYDAELRRIAVYSLCRAATLLAHQGDYAGAEKNFLRALELIPTDPMACNEFAMFLREQGRTADALLAQQRLVANDPQTLMHYVNLASLASEAGDLAEAEAALNQLVAMRPDLALGYTGLAQVHLQRGNAAQARTYAETALKQTTGAPAELARTHLILAAACEQLGDDRAAEASLAMAKSLSGGR